MGWFSCIVFGLLIAWLTGALYPKWKLKSLKLWALAGIAGGTCGIAAAWLFNIAYFSQFNIYALVFSTICVLFLMWLQAKRSVHI